MLMDGVTGGGIGQLALPLDRARHIRGVLVRDSAFLRDLNIMDYSLLAGVHRTTRRMADIAGTGMWLPFSSVFFIVVVVAVR